MCIRDRSWKVPSSCPLPDQAAESFLLWWIDVYKRQSREFHGVSSMKSRMYLDEKTYYNQMAEMKEDVYKRQDQKIKKIGKELPEKEAERVINADGCYVMPGFIDTVSYTHLGET